MSRRQRIILSMGLIVVFCGLSGCVSKTQDGDASVYKMQTWLPILILVGGALALLMGILAIRQKTYLGGILLAAAGPVAAGLFAVPMLTQETRVDKEHFETEYGFFWSPSKHNIRYSDLKEIRIVEEVSRGRRGRKKYNYSMHCLKKDGGTEVVSLGTLLQEAADEIVENAEAKGITIIEPEAR